MGGVYPLPQAKSRLVHQPFLSGRWVSIILLILAGAMISGCLANAITPTEVRLFHYHGEKNIEIIKEFITRLYAKNPRYQGDPVRRQKRLQQLSNNRPTLDKYAHWRSDEVLTEVFSEIPGDPDRVYLLGLGLVKSIREVYGPENNGLILIGLQIPLERLQRLHFNMSQVNWRIKTYKDGDGVLFFKTNEAGDDGYINMGYEVLMTEMLARIEDDIYLRGGLSKKYIFDMSTLFVSLLL